MIKLKRVDDAFKLEATNERGDVIHTDGSAAIGAGEDGFRPMEMLLVSLAGCSAIDIISILKKQRQKITEFNIDIDGDRVEGTPAPFKAIRLHFVISGQVKDAKVEKAIELTKSKYCSVFFSLHPDINVSYTYNINHEDLD